MKTAQELRAGNVFMLGNDAMVVQKPSANGKHHFFFIRAIDSLVNKWFGEKMPEVDPLDEIPYNLHLKKIFE